MAAISTFTATDGDDLAGFVALARGGQRPVFYTAGGNGSPRHLAMELLRQRAELPPTALEHVPERGNAEAVAALLAGTVQAASPNISGAAELVRAGRLRAIAVSGGGRGVVEAGPRWAGGTGGTGAVGSPGIAGRGRRSRGHVNMDP